MAASRSAPGSGSGVGPGPVDRPDPDPDPDGAAGDDRAVAVGGTGDPDRGADHAERLRLPWWLWLAAVGLAALLATEIWLGSDGARAWLPYLVLLPVTVSALWWLGRIQVAVRDGELLVDDARLPVRFVADAIPLDAEGRREVLGVGADPLAFVVQRPWVPAAVQIVLDDPADPTPYWVVSSRDPVRLATAVLRARDGSPRGGTRPGAPDGAAGSAVDSAGAQRRPPLP